MEKVNPLHQIEKPAPKLSQKVKDDIKYDLSQKLNDSRYQKTNIFREALERLVKNDYQIDEKFPEKDRIMYIQALEFMNPISRAIPDDMESGILSKVLPIVNTVICIIVLIVIIIK